MALTVVQGPMSPWPSILPERPDPRVCLQPLLSLDNLVTTRFTDAGDVRVTVQAACGNSVLQDSRLIRVLGELSPDSLHRPAWVGTWLQRACSFLESLRLQSPGGFGFCDWLCSLIEVFQTLWLQFPPL